MYITSEDKRRKIFDSALWQKPFTIRKKTAKRQHNNATKNYDYTTIADRLMTLSQIPNLYG